MLRSRLAMLETIGRCLCSRPRFLAMTNHWFADMPHGRSAAIQVDPRATLWTVRGGLNRILTRNAKSILHWSGLLVEHLRQLLEGRQPGLTSECADGKPGHAIRQHQ